MADAWNPGQYERFKTERSQPFYDLLALVRPGVADAIDLGCGTGELTADLHRRLSARRTTGVDQSPAMLERAEEQRAEGLTFVAGDIERWEPGSKVDVVFSNAAIQWVPSHHELLTRFTDWLKPGGQIAIQMPTNFDHPSHTAATEVADLEPFRSALGGFRREIPVLPAEDYATLLHRLGYREQRVMVQVYGHVLPNREGVVEWVKGSLLTTYRERLSPERYEEFLGVYRRRLADLVPESQPYFYPFKRILLWGRRPV